MQHVCAWGKSTKVSTSVYGVRQVLGGVGTTVES